MAQKKPRDMIVGRPVLLVVDIQKGSFMPRRPDSMLEFMPDSEARCRRARTVVDAARAAGVFAVAVAWGGIHRVEDADAFVESPEELLGVL